MLKKTFYISLTIIIVFSLIFNISGYLLIFKALQYQAKEEIKETIFSGISKENLELIKIPVEYELKGNKDFRRIHEKEFEYKGMLYDIVYEETEDDTNYFYCINDVNEERIIKNYKEFVEKNKSGENSANKKAISLVKNIVKDYLPAKKIKLAQNSELIEYVNISINNYSSIILKTPKPPPKLIS